MASFQESHAVLIFLRRGASFHYPVLVISPSTSARYSGYPHCWLINLISLVWVSLKIVHPPISRFSRHSLLKLLWDVVGIPPFFPRWIRRAQFCWSSARRKWRIWCVIICWTPSHLTVSERLRPTDDGQRKSFASSLTDRISVKDDFYGIYNHIISHIYIYAHIHMRA